MQHGLDPIVMQPYSSRRRVGTSEGWLTPKEKAGREREHDSRLNVLLCGVVGAGRLAGAGNEKHQPMHRVKVRGTMPPHVASIASSPMPEDDTPGVVTGHRHDVIYATAPAHTSP